MSQIQEFHTLSKIKGSTTAPTVEPTWLQFICFTLTQFGWDEVQSAGQIKLSTLCFFVIFFLF